MQINFYLLCCLVIPVSFQMTVFADGVSRGAAESVTKEFRKGLTDFEEKIIVFTEAAEDLKPEQTSIESLKQAHLETRLSFKKIEYLVEYIDPFAVKKSINGAPLPTVEPAVPEVIPVAPTGLQVLDELIFAEDIFDNKTEIVRLVKKLRKDYSSLKAYQSGIRITHRQIFEAIRQELVRIMTLGVTGFDTPGSVNALPEAQAAFEGMYSALKFYLPLLEEKDFGFAVVLEARFQEAIKFLSEAEDFDSFDRLVFLKNHIDPLYSVIYNIHRSLGIETSDEISDRPQPVNYEAESIFAADFLNPSYYANIDLSTEVAEKRKALGRILFFDPILSENNKMSCATCHDPQKWFADGEKTSLGSDGKTRLKRNSPSLVNAVFSERYFYDLREPGLERQIKHVVMNQHEFATDFRKIKEKINESEEYIKLFEEAYADHPRYKISKWSVSDALANYTASLVSFNSPVDQYLRGEVADIHPSVKRGFNLFMGKAGCGTCHFAPTFSGTVPPLYAESESEILGVPATSENKKQDSDPGRYDSGRPIDKADFYKHSFKTVSIRNVAETAPYMHNGVYETLEEVMDFYNNGGGAGIGYEVPHQTLPDAPLNLTEFEIVDIIAFMEALTDETVSEKTAPERLPFFENHPERNNRMSGGRY